LTLTRATYGDFKGWLDDDVAAAMSAFLRSCAAIRRKNDDAPLDRRPKGTDFGRIADWRASCEGAAAVPKNDKDAARHFFETEFVPFLAGNNLAPNGLFTGYFEITLHGSRQRGGPYQTPIYRRPPEPDQYTRAEIEDGALAGKGLELLWVDSPIDEFFLEIQGSGLVQLGHGKTARVGYDGSNRKPYVAVGRLLIERSEVPREKMTMDAIREWMAANPQKGAALRRENPSYVFFRELTGDGPLGAEQVALTPGRSLAVDRHFIALGVPVWLEAKERFSDASERRLVVAQDTGGAIKGPVRGDLFWGNGSDAAKRAGAMNARGQYFLLLPRALAERRQTQAPH
jgi:membrane-bound lytic murein transglycosylase A